MAHSHHNAEDLHIAVTLELSSHDCHYSVHSAISHDRRQGIGYRRRYQRMVHQGLPRRCKLCRLRSTFARLTGLLQGRSKNKIRSVVAGLDLSQTKSDKPLINLGLGDPTVFGLHDPPKVAIEAMQDALIGGNANGYLPGTGLKEACQAVADYHKRWDGVDYAAEDVTLVSSGTAISVTCR